AHGVCPVARHLDDFDSAESADHVARRQVDVVVAAEVAAVVIGDTLVERRTGQREATVGHELGEELAVVDYLVVSAELRILVLDDVEAVRTLSNDLAYTHGVERVDVLHGEHLKYVLVARPARL